jgi:acyl-coenzyme A synthetase/AMP-(fatty) acid ligase
MRGAKVTAGLIADQMPARLRAAPIFVDRELDLAPRLGRAFDRGAVADLIVETSARLAACGVRAGSRVAVMKQNGFDIPVIALACQRIGAVPVLISSATQPDEAAELLGTAAPELLVTDRPTFDASGLADVPFVGRVCVAGEGGPLGLPEPVVPAPAPVRSESGAERALVTHSSGTTGTPKLVVQTVDTFDLAVDFNYRLARLIHLKGPIAGHMSLAHVRSLAAVAALLRLSNPLMAITGEDPEPAMKLLSEFRPVMVEAQPAGFVAWEPYLNRHPAALAGVRFFASTFDAPHPRTIKALLAASRVRLPLYVSIYGQSETGPITVRANSRLTAEHADGRCVGHPIPGHSHLRIGKDREAGGRIGPIEVRSKTLCAEYLGRADLYGSKRHGRWWEMNDRGYRSRFGCLHLMDREDDAIDGVQSLLAIEDALLERLPQLREVVLVPDEQGLPRPVIATFDGIDLPEDAWYTNTADLPPLGDPLVRDYTDLPRTATGKVKRHRLRELLRER